MRGRGTSPFKNPRVGLVVGVLWAGQCGGETMNYDYYLKDIEVAIKEIKNAKLYPDTPLLCDVYALNFGSSAVFPDYRLRPDAG